MDIAEVGLLRRSEKRNLRTLTELSLQAVVFNIHRYCQQEDEPFACLPSDIMTILTETERQYRKSQSGALHSYKYKMYCTSSQMISWNTQRVYLEAFGWEVDVIEALIKRIMYKCAESLLTLQLSYCSPQVLPTLHRLIPRILRLRKLEINGRLGNNTLLAAVGEHLEQLRDLAMDSSSISDIGINYLCIPHKKYGKCKNLESIHLNSTNSVTAGGILNLLENLPKLRIIHHRQLVKAILMFAHNHKGKSLNFEGEIFGRLEKWKITNENIEIFLKTVPKLKKINFFQELLGNTSIETFKLAQNVSGLEINIGIISINLYSELINNFSAKLKYLKIESVNILIDISLIAKLCVNIEELHYKAKTTYSQQYSGENTFKRLKIICIEDLTGNISENILCSILLSNYLEFLTFVRTLKLNDQFLHRIFLESKFNIEIFSRLKLLRFCFIPNISIVSIQHFICLAPLLESVEVTNCSNVNSEDYTALLQFVIDMGWEDELELL